MVAVLLFHPHRGLPFVRFEFVLLVLGGREEMVFSLRGLWEGWGGGGGGGRKVEVRDTISDVLG